MGWLQNFKNNFLKVIFITFLFWILFDYLHLDFQLPHANEPKMKPATLSSESPAQTSNYLVTSSILILAIGVGAVSYYWFKKWSIELTSLFNNNINKTRKKKFIQLGKEKTLNSYKNISLLAFIKHQKCCKTCLLCERGIFFFLSKMFPFAKGDCTKSLKCRRLREETELYKLQAQQK